MCLAVPMRVASIEGDRARVEVDGVGREVSIALVEAVAVGDHVLVHAGFAIERLDAAAAEETLRLFRELAEAAEAEAGE
jgi:hydrogenase expression/formation protein HypC